MKKRIILLSMLLVLIFTSCAIKQLDTSNNYNDVSEQDIVVSMCCYDNESLVSVVEQYFNTIIWDDGLKYQSLFWKNKDKTLAELEDITLGVLNMQVLKIIHDEEKTKSAKINYIDSELAKDNNWSSEFLEENFSVVYTEYIVDYDNEKVPYDDGKKKEYFYMLRENKRSSWLIWSKSSIQI